MPRIKPSKPPVAEHNNTAEFQLTMKLLNVFKDTWHAQMNEAADVNPMTFSRMGVVALTQWSAIVAVDIGMSQEQYVAVCRAQFAAMYAKAPKFS